MMKNSLIIILLFTSISLWGENITFKWAVFRGDEILHIASRIKAEPGDEFKFFIEPIENSYIYLFAYREAGQLSLLFPGSPDDFKKKGYWKSKNVIPPLENWYVLPGDPGGEDEFFLIVSPEPLKNWNRILKKSPDEKEVEKLYGELKSMLRQYKVPAVLLEEAVLIAGSIKSIKTPSVRKITCSSLYLEWFKLVY